MASFPVHYERKDYDIEDFLNRHPGGVNYLASYKNKEIYQKMCDTGHSKAAHYLLKDYKVQKREDQIPEDDEDLEHLIDWNKPILSQVGSLGNKYKEWVNSPVTRQMRLFENELLEKAFGIPFYVVPLLWLPVGSLYLYKGCNIYIESALPGSPVGIPILLNVTLGVGLWTVLEYMVHRWMLHAVPNGSLKLMLYIHFIIHGVHHKVPFDTRAHVFPPAFTLVVLCILHNILAAVFQRQEMHIILGTLLFGYVAYDMVHYYVHNGKPDGGYWYYMKRYHNQHHYIHHDQAFGVSNPVWDAVFGTLVKLRKLSMKIKWSRKHQQ